MAQQDMVDIIDLKLVGYGNTKKSGDTFTCQHGAGECTTDVMDLCTQYKLSGDINSINTGDTSKAAWPFIYCMEKAMGNPAQGQSCFESSMGNSTLTWSTVNDCVNNESVKVQTAAAEATPSDHTYVPWCLVDGTLIKHEQLLQQYICDAYTGSKPASCSKMTVSANNEVRTPCMANEGF